MGHEFDAREKPVVPNVVRMVMGVKKEIDSPIGRQGLQSLLVTSRIHQQSSRVPDQERITMGKDGELAEKNSYRSDVSNLDHLSKT